MNFQETRQPEWNDGGNIAASESEGWDNSFGGLGADIALQQPIKSLRSQKADDARKAALMVIDLAASPPKV